MRKAGFSDYACPCCGGELVGVPEADLGLGGDGGIGADEFRNEPWNAREPDLGMEAETESGMDSDGGDEESESSSDDDAGGLEFDDRGATATKAIRDFGWDGRAETMPGEWKGRGYFVIATYGEVRRGARRRVVMDGCVVTCFGRAGKTSFRSGRDAYSPTLFEDVEAARRALRDAWDWTMGRWGGTRIASRDLIERKPWYSDEFVKAAEVIPVESYHPVRRSDVLAELAEEALAEMGDAERERETRRRAEASRLSAERARLRKVNGGRVVDNWRAGMVISGEPSEGSRLAPSEDFGPDGLEDVLCDVESDCEGRPVPCGIVQDWSKVDWDEEARESDLRDMETRPASWSKAYVREVESRVRRELDDVRRASRGVATARETERWLLQDWETGKFVRVDGGTATLVDRDDCTFFERLADANGVAIGIERLFWRPEFARWRLHVVPLCGTA